MTVATLAVFIALVFELMAMMRIARVPAADRVPRDLTTVRNRS